MPGRRSYYCTQGTLTDKQRARKAKDLFFSRAHSAAGTKFVETDTERAHRLKLIDKGIAAHDALDRVNGRHCHNSWQAATLARHSMPFAERRRLNQDRAAGNAAKHRGLPREALQASNLSIISGRPAWADFESRESYPSLPASAGLPASELSAPATQPEDVPICLHDAPYVKSDTSLVVAAAAASFEAVPKDVAGAPVQWAAANGIASDMGDLQEALKAHSAWIGDVSQSLREAHVRCHRLGEEIAEIRDQTQMKLDSKVDTTEWNDMTDDLDASVKTVRDKLHCVVDAKVSILNDSMNHKLSLLMQEWSVMLRACVPKAMELCTESLIKRVADVEKKIDELDPNCCSGNQVAHSSCSCSKHGNHNEPAASAANFTAQPCAATAAVRWLR